MERTRKYAKWKATYIHNCLKNGETPIAGPPGEQPKPEDNFGGSLEAPPQVPSLHDFGFQQPPKPDRNAPPPNQVHGGYTSTTYPDNQQHLGYPSQNYGFQAFSFMTSLLGNSFHFT